MKTNYGTCTALMALLIVLSLASFANATVQRVKWYPIEDTFVDYKSGLRDTNFGTDTGLAYTDGTGGGGTADIAKTFLKFKVLNGSIGVYDLICKRKIVYANMPNLFLMHPNEYTFDENTTTWNNQPCNTTLTTKQAVEESCPGVAEYIGEMYYNATHIRYPVEITQLNTVFQYMLTASGYSGGMDLWSREGSASDSCYLQSSSCTSDFDCDDETEFCYNPDYMCVSNNILLNATYADYPGIGKCVRLEWNASSVNETDYNFYLYRKTNSTGEYGFLYSVGRGVDGAYDCSAAQNSQYDYYVIAKNESGREYGKSDSKRVYTVGSTISLSGITYYSNGTIAPVSSLILYNNLGNTQTATSTMVGGYSFSIPTSFKSSNNVYFLHSEKTVGTVLFTGGQVFTMFGDTVQNIYMASTASLGNLTFALQYNGMAPSGLAGTMRLDGNGLSFNTSCAVNTTTWKCTMLNVPEGYYKITSNFTNGYYRNQIASYYISGSGVDVFDVYRSVSIRVSGTVIDTSNNNLSGVFVSFSNKDTGMYYGNTTVANGTYTAVMPSGTYSAIPILGNYTALNPITSTLLDYSQTIDFIMQLGNAEAMEKVVITGNTTQADLTTNIPFVIIQGVCNPHLTSINTQSDFEGKYVITGIPKDSDCEITFSKTGYIPKTVYTGTLNANKTNSNVFLYKKSSIYATLYGYVKDCKTGSALGGYTVLADGDNPQKFSNWKFNYTVLQNRTYDITITKTGYSNRTIEDVVIGSDITAWINTTDNTVCLSPLSSTCSYEFTFYKYLGTGAQKLEAETCIQLSSGSYGTFRECTDEFGVVSGNAPCGTYKMDACALDEYGNCDITYNYKNTTKTLTYGLDNAETFYFSKSGATSTTVPSSSAVYYWMRGTVLYDTNGTYAATNATVKIYKDGSLVGQVVVLDTGGGQFAVQKPQGTYELEASNGRITSSRVNVNLNRDYDYSEITIVLSSMIQRYLLAANDVFEFILGLLPLALLAIFLIPIAGIVMLLSVIAYAMSPKR